MPSQKKTTVEKTTTPAEPAAKTREKAAASEASGASGAKEAKKETKEPRPRRTSSPRSPIAEKAAKAAELAKNKHDRIFALDIGTRSVIGIVAEQDAGSTMHIIETARLEHKTRAMLDGQIHDVPQVAAIISEVKGLLEEKTGPLHNAAVAAAGRALYTMTGEAEVEVGGLITAEQQQNLDFSGVQAAQAKLASSNAIEDPTRYYCVGYSTIRYVLDDNELKSLIGQRGKKAKAVVIATFLPRQVIDSMQSALHDTGLEMRALTLEPIAAINVLIPPTMRHLNLVLVDIGAGTSDIAITKNGSVIAYGMVPLAGDEITEAISQRFLLDFNVAEDIKRRASHGEDTKFTDILGQNYELSAKEVLDPIIPNVQNLAGAIAKTILDLNGDVPQAVMLVGGGSLTPHLQECVAEALGMPENRVAVRHPESVVGMADIPKELQSPDAVTPLGILKIASLNTLHFLSVYVNGEEYSLFNFRELTVTDALLNAGISLRKYNGRPGLGLMVNIGTERKTFPGTMGTLARITVNDEEAELDTVIRDGAHIDIIPGENGTTPEVRLKDLVTTGEEYTIYINGREKHIRQKVTVNGEEADGERLLKDGDTIESRAFKSIGEALAAAGYPPTGRKIRYKLNGKDTFYSCTPEILLDDEPANIAMPIHEGDHIEYLTDDAPKIGEVLGLTDSDTAIRIYYEGEEVHIPSANVTLTVNGRSASPGTLIDDGFDIVFEKEDRTTTTVSEALLAVGFQPPAATSRVSFAILVNGAPADFTDIVKNGDTLAVELTDLNAQEKAPATPASHVTTPEDDARAMEEANRPHHTMLDRLKQAGIPVEVPEAQPLRTSAVTASGQSVPTLSAINAGAYGTRHAATPTPPPAATTPTAHEPVIPIKHIPGMPMPPSQQQPKKSLTDFIHRG